MQANASRIVLCAAFLAAASCGQFSAASAQGVATPWQSPDEIFRQSNQLLAELNALKCRDPQALYIQVRVANLNIAARPYLGGSPSLVQIGQAIAKAEQRYLALPPCYGHVGGFGSGFYVGGSVGGQRAETGWTTRNLTSINIADPIEESAIHASPADTGFVGGIFVGYNLPLTDKLITGVEVGINFGNTESTISGIPGIGAFLPMAVGHGDKITIKNKSGATIVGHLGVLVNPQMHAYGLFGYAWQRTDVTFSCDNSVGFCSAAPAADAFSATKSVTFSGPVLGAGLEFLIGGGWVGRAEYRHKFLNDQNVSLGDPATRSVGASLDQNVNEVMAGLRYAFGAPPPPP